jgi:hypothetical protein
MSLALRRGLDPLIPAPVSGSNLDRTFVARRLRKNALTLIAANPKVALLGPDDLAENIADRLEFEPHDLVILRVIISNRRHTLVCIPESVWFRRKSALVELKRMAIAAGHNCVLVPEAAIQRQPRLSTAQAIEGATGVTVSMEQRMDLFLHLIDAGSSTLFDCACAMRSHPAPFSAVLHMVALGIVELRGTGYLSPQTRIDLPEPALVMA